MYKSCKTINDYRNYIEHYGRGGKHYLEAKKKVDKHVSDSIRTLLDKEVKDAIQKYKEEHPEELDREVEEALQIYHEEEPIEEDIEQRIGDEVAKTRWEMEEEYENSEAEVAYEAVDVNLEFEVGKAEVKDSEYNKNELKKISDDLDKGREIRYIIVQDYTSPDGDEKQNIKISQDRADAAVKYIKKGLGEYANNITFQSKGMGSDWDGLAEAVRNSNLTNKDEILKVIDEKDAKSLNALKEKTPELKNLVNTIRRVEIYLY